MVRSLIRLTVTALLLVGATVFVYMKLTDMWHLRAIEERDRMIAAMTERLEQKEAMIDRLSRSRRLAYIEIVDQRVGVDGEPVETTLRFIEVDEQGRELGRQVFTIDGGVMFIDTWTAKFSADDVAAGHPFRGRTLVLFRRIYSETVAPGRGEPIDTPGGVPSGYAGSDVALFEQRIWERFWSIASDPDLAARFGIRVAQGEVVYKPVRAGQSFTLIVDAAGGVNLVAGTPDGTDFLTVVEESP